MRGDGRRERREEGEKRGGGEARGRSEGEKRGGEARGRSEGEKRGGEATGEKRRGRRKKDTFSVASGIVILDEGLILLGVPRQPHPVPLAVPQRHL